MTQSPATTRIPESGVTWSNRLVPVSTYQSWMKAHDRALTIVVLVAFPLAYGTLGLHLGQDAGWDLQNYHYFDPYWLLVNHMRDVMPAQLQTYYSPLLDVPFYFAVNHMAPRLVGFLLAVIQGVSFPILYLISRHFTQRRLLALVLAGLGMLTAGAMTEVGTISGDNLIAPLLLGAILIALHSLDSSRTDSLDSSRTASPHSFSVANLIVISCVLAGIAAGLKLSGSAIALGIAIAYPLAAKGALRRVRHGLYAGCGILAGLLLSYGWWGYELASRYGNPILPYMNRVFHSMYAPWLANNDTSYLPHGIVDILFYPIIWAQYPHRVNPNIFLEASLPFLEVLLIALVLLSGIYALRTRTRFTVFDNTKQRYLMIVVVVSYLLWVIEFGNYRYLIPIEMLSFIAILVCIQAMRQRTPWQQLAVYGRQLSVFGLAAIVFFSLVTELPGTSWGRSSWTQHYFIAAIPSQLTAQPSAFLMLGGNPNAYVVPMFPQRDFFAQAEGNLPPTIYLKRKIIKELQGYSHVYIIWSDPTPSWMTMHLLEYNELMARHFGYTVEEKSCLEFPTMVGDTAIRFHTCKLTTA